MRGFNDEEVKLIHSGGIDISLGERIKEIDADNVYIYLGIFGSR